MALLARQDRAVACMFRYQNPDDDDAFKQEYPERRVYPLRGIDEIVKRLPPGLLHDPTSYSLLRAAYAAVGYDAPRGDRQWALPEAQLALEEAALTGKVKIHYTSCGAPESTFKDWMRALRTATGCFDTAQFAALGRAAVSEAIRSLSMGAQGRPSYLTKDETAVLMMKTILQTGAGDSMSRKRVGDEARVMCQRLAGEMGDSEQRKRLETAKCGRQFLKTAQAIFLEVAGETSFSESEALSAPGQRTS